MQQLQNTKLALKEEITHVKLQPNPKDLTFNISNLSFSLCLYVHSL